MFILMTIFMGLNVYFCIPVILGMGLGYLIFGSKMELELYAIG